jgi:hypothetical protein
MKNVVIRFDDVDLERAALGFLAGRFSFTTRDSGTTTVPATALPALREAGIEFTVDEVSTEPPHRAL